VNLQIHPAHSHFGQAAVGSRRNSAPSRNPSSIPGFRWTLHPSGHSLQAGRLLEPKACLSATPSGRLLPACRCRGKSRPALIVTLRALLALRANRTIALACTRNASTSGLLALRASRLVSLNCGNLALGCATPERGLASLVQLW